ncbi:MAG: hypothetical protein H0X66_18715 [Verrucomicrobia bacterium]|nr:hypothetical protein [Verrucomicrobiota bacterium]
MRDNQITKEFFDWIRQGNSGCIFAKLFVLRGGDTPWEASVIRAETFDAPTVEAIGETLKLASKRSEAIQLILPNIKTPEQIARMISCLCKNPNWYCTEIIPKPSEYTSSFLAGLRWKLPDAVNVNWVLGFADIETMPPTRRAPYTSLAIRLGQPGTAPSVAKDKPNEVRSRKKENGLVPVHLADMPTPFLKDDAIKKTWVLTEQTAGKMLNPTPEFRTNAHAKVTFALPMDLRDSLIGCFTPVAMDSKSEIGAEEY